MVKKEITRYQSINDTIYGTKSVYEPYNVIIRRYPDHNEIMCRDDVSYKRRRGFEDPQQNLQDRRPRFEFDQDHRLVPKKFNVSLSDLLSTLRRSRSRSLDSIYDFALSNNWDYFMTFTFSPEKVSDRFDRSSIVRSWSCFRSKVYFYDPRAKFLCIPELHPSSGAIHLHCLCSGNLDRFLVPAEHNGKPILSKFGDQIFNLSLFSYGFSTVAKLDRNNLRVANYLTKYISKDCLSVASYKQRTYFSSHGLKRCTREYMCLDSNELADLLADRLVDGIQYRIDQQCKTVLKKVCDRFLIYVQSLDIYSQNDSLSDNGDNFTYL